MYERGLALFKWPHVRDLWQTYLSQFVQRYKGSKLERARDLFRQAIESVSPSASKCVGEVTKPGHLARSTWPPPTITHTWHCLLHAKDSKQLVLQSFPKLLLPSAVCQAL